jgi:hypothetical protein
MFRKKQDEWWQRSNEEQNADMAEAPADAATAHTTPAADAAAESPAEEAGKTGKKKKKSRWDWWDAAGDILEVVLDFVTDLFD